MPTIIPTTGPSVDFRSICEKNYNGTLTTSSKVDVCCSNTCGEGMCGSSDCGSLPGGKRSCCNSAIRKAGVICGDGSRAPCLLPKPCNPTDGEGFRAPTMEIPPLGTFSYRPRPGYVCDSLEGYCNPDGTTSRPINCRPATACSLTSGPGYDAPTSSVEHGHVVTFEPVPGYACKGMTQKCLDGVLPELPVCIWTGPRNDIGVGAEAVPTAQPTSTPQPTFSHYNQIIWVNENPPNGDTHENISSEEESSSTFGGPGAVISLGLIVTFVLDL